MEVNSTQSAVSGKQIIVELSTFNVFVSAMTGVSRNIKSIAPSKGYNGIDNRKRGWQDNCDGALGEQALAKWLNVYWDGTPNTFRKKPDVAEYEVRTNAESWGDLIIRDRDKDDAIYILVLSHDCPRFVIRGWMMGGDAKQDQWRRAGDRSRPEAWFVPQSELHDMDSLPR
jgi:hypothetical protein